MNNLLDKKSRTAVKHEVENLQKLGEKLALFSIDQIKAMDIPEELKKAVIIVKSIDKFGAKRRQFQYIGSLMRKIDPDIVIEAVNKISMGRDIAVEKNKKIEKWWNDLIHDPGFFVEKLMGIYPEIDRQRLRLLIRNAKKEMENDRKSKSASSLLKYLREIFI